ncbi:enoyl-CoA hydratase/isomerase family protein [Chloroflexota bacterium]
MANDKVLYEKRGKTAIITINRPEAMNAYDREASRLLVSYGQDAVNDPEVWTVILTGAGDKAFSAGMDMKETDVAYNAGRLPSDQRPEEVGRPRSRSMMSYPSPMTKPIIAAINGFCVGGGLEQAMGCDIRIAAEHAIFEISEPKRGMIPGITPAKLPRLIHHNIALELMLTCRRFDAQEAYHIGLVSKVVPLADLMPTALAMADQINANAPLAIRAIKEIAWRGMSLTLSEALFEGQRMLRETIYPTEDSKEGTRAFVEKRAPVWKGK